MSYTEQEQLALLHADPEKGMAVLIDAYQELLWAVCRQHLRNEEDIRECVNETFALFYLHRENYDPQKGSLRSYLATIAHRTAIRQYNWLYKGKAVPHTLTEEDLFHEPIEEYLSHQQIESALANLSSEDAMIVRMKYYNGMTSAQIATALNLPYETVKKRQQRSLIKLRKYLLLSLAVVLLALLAACGYHVLQYFGVVPGYGINRNAEDGTFILSEPVKISWQGQQMLVQDAFWQNGLLTVYMESSGQLLENAHSSDATICVAGLEDMDTRAIKTVVSAQEPHIFQLFVPGKLPMDHKDRLELTVSMGDDVFSLTLVQTQEQPPQSVGFVSMTNEGGLLAVPRIENGELIVTIYPLNTGDFDTYFFLTAGVWSKYGGPVLPVTVSDAQGNVLQGTPAPYSPFSGAASLDWHFGPAQPGEYTLHVPYVYQCPSGEKTSYALTVLLDSTQNISPLSLPGGTLQLNDLRLIDAPLQLPLVSGNFSDEQLANCQWWAVDMSWQSGNQERTLAAANFIKQVDLTGSPLYTQLTAQDTGEDYRLITGYLFGTALTAQVLKLEFPSDGLCYRWDHPFDIPMVIN